jgi:hypothetical protein
MRKLLLFLATVTAAGCSTAQIQLPSSLASSAEVVPVKRAFLLQSRDAMTIGGTSITDFHDAKKTRVRSDSVLPPYVPDLPGVPRVSEATTKQTIRFIANEEGAPRWTVVCQSRSDSNDLVSQGGSLEMPGHFRGETICAIDGAGNETARWTLNLSQYRPGIDRTSIKGELTDGTTTYDLTPIYRITDASGQRGTNVPYPLGFTIQRGDEAVAAIDTMAQGRTTARVHFGRGLDASERSLIATVSAAVLLQQEDRGGVTVGR